MNVTVTVTVNLPGNTSGQGTEPGHVREHVVGHASVAEQTDKETSGTRQGSSKKVDQPKGVRQKSQTVLLGSVKVTEKEP